MDFKEVEQIPIFFILGKSRSGTTLLQTMLDAHPNTIVPVESIFLLYLKKKYFNTKNWNEKRIDQFVDDLYKERKFRHFWKVDKEKLRVDLYAIPKNKISFSLLCKYVYLSYPSAFAKEKIMFVGDKNPVYPFFIEAILSVFPEAKFIHLIRDYRDVIVSSREVLASRSVARFAYEWKWVNEHIEKIKSKHPSSFYTLKYEDLIAQPEVYLTEISTFLKMPFFQKMLDFYRRSENSFYNNAHSNTLFPINTKSVDKWKLKLNEKEISIADFIAGELGKKYDYEVAITSKKYFFKISLLVARWCQKSEIFIFKWYQKMPIGIKNAKALFAETFHISTYHSQAEDRFIKEK